MTAMDETFLRAPRERVDRAAAGRRDRQVAGRHERRVQLVEAVEQPVRATRATRHAERAGWAEQVRRVACPAKAWWAERAGAGRGTSGTIGAPAPTPPATVAPGAVVTPVRAVGGSRTPSAAPARTADAHRTPVSACDPTVAPGLDAEPMPRHLAVVGRRARWNEDVVTGWCSLLLVLGLCLDGWTRSTLGTGGPVLTLWHGLLYLGFGVTVWWILTREQRPGSWSLRAVPPGYRLGLVGVGLAMVAVTGDAVWRALSGAEQGVARLVAPFHLVLLAGACLLGGSALRAAWSGPSPARVPGLKAFWPVVASVTLVVAVTALLFQDVSPLAAEAVPVHRLLGLLLHNLLFVAAVLLLLLRWQTPLGAFTVVAGSVALLVATQTGFGLVGLVGAAVLGGTAADVAVAFLRPSPQRRWAARAVAVIAPAVYWTAHFALLEVGYGAGWDPALWLGAVLWACLSGFALAWLMWPPAVPLTAWNRGRTRTPSTTTPTAMPARMVGR